KAPTDARSASQLALPHPPRPRTSTVLPSAMNSQRTADRASSKASADHAIVVIVAPALLKSRQSNARMPLLADRECHQSTMTDSAEPRPELDPPRPHSLCSSLWPLGRRPPAQVSV